MFILALDKYGKRYIKLTLIISHSIGVAEKENNSKLSLLYIYKCLNGYYDYVYIYN